MVNVESINVLIVEDDPVNCMVLKGLLAKSTLNLKEIDAVDTVSRAINCIKEKDQDVILLDLNLPDSRGLRTLECLIHRFPRKPIVVITGEQDEQLGLSAISKGAQEYLVKGRYTVESLSQAIRYSIGRKEVEELARQEHQLFETLISQLPQKILLKDCNSVFHYCNENYANAIGMSPEQIVGKTDYDFYPNDKAEQYIAGDREIIASGGTAEFYFRYRDKGDEKISRLLKTAVKNDRGRTEGVLCIFEDVTERKRAEKALRESEEQFKSLVSNIPGIAYRCKCDKDWTMLYISDEVESVTGYRASDFINNSVRTFESMIHRDDTDATSRKTKEAISGGTSWEIEYRIIHKNGDVRWVLEKGRAVKNCSGVVRYLDGFILDVTERVLADERIKATNKELEDTNRRLKDTQLQVVQNEKLASLGQLAAGVAHEINNPMAFVMGNFSTLKGYVNGLLEMLDVHEKLVDEIHRKERSPSSSDIAELERLKDKLNIDFVIEDTKDLFSDSEEGMSRVLHIVRSLRDFSRIDQPQDLSYYNLNDGIRSTLVVARNELKYSADIETEFADVPEVFCNSGQINQVFLNILLNAAQAIESRGEEGESTGRIRIRTYLDDEHIACEIADNGPGISEENLPRLFDPFFTTKPTGKGTGLGLNVSYDIIVNKHKGLLLVESDVGKGAVFTIKIPIRQDCQSEFEKDISHGTPNSIVCR